MNEFCSGNIEYIRDQLLWSQPKSVGLALVTGISHYKDDIVFINCGGKDLTKETSVMTPSGLVREGDTVEVIIQEKRQIRKPYNFPDCRVAIRIYDRTTYGSVTIEDRVKLEAILRDKDNIKNAFNDRAFYRKFFSKAKERLKPFPEP